MWKHQSSYSLRKLSLLCLYTPFKVLCCSYFQIILNFMVCVHAYAYAIITRVFASSCLKVNLLPMFNSMMQLLCMTNLTISVNKWGLVETGLKWNSCGFNFSKIKLLTTTTVGSVNVKMINESLPDIMCEPVGTLFILWSYWHLL